MLFTKPKLSQKERILKALKKHDLTSRDFIDMNIFRYSARLGDLRKEGYDIQCKHVKGSLFKYCLENKK